MNQTEFSRTIIRRGKLRSFIWAEAGNALSSTVGVVDAIQCPKDGRSRITCFPVAVVAYGLTAAMECLKMVHVSNCYLNKILEVLTAKNIMPHLKIKLIRRGQWGLAKYFMRQKVLGKQLPQDQKNLNPRTRVALAITLAIVTTQDKSLKYVGTV